jgi:hypothetical protein
VRHGAIGLRGGQIADIAAGAAVPPGAIDCEGDLLLPGPVELHTDNLERERHIEPRPRVDWPQMAATIAPARSDGARDPAEVCRRCRAAGHDVLAPADDVPGGHGCPIADARPFRTDGCTARPGAGQQAGAMAKGEPVPIPAVGLPPGSAPSDSPGFAPRPGRGRRGRDADRPAAAGPSRRLARAAGDAARRGGAAGPVGPASALIGRLWSAPPDRARGQRSTREGDRP